MVSPPLAGGFMEAARYTCPMGGPMVHRNQCRSISGSASSNEPLPQKIVKRALRCLALRQEVVELGAFIFGCGQELFEALTLVALQADPDRGQDRRMLLRESLRHLDLGQRLFGPSEESFVVLTFIVGHPSRPFGRPGPRYHRPPCDGSCTRSPAVRRY